MQLYDKIVSYIFVQSGINYVCRNAKWFSHRLLNVERKYNVDNCVFLCKANIAQLLINTKVKRTMHIDVPNKLFIYYYIF